MADHFLLSLLRWPKKASTIKGKIIFTVAIFLILIIGCLISGIWGLQQVHKGTHRASVAVKIHDNFDGLMILFEHSLMGPHDYLIHGNKEEKEIFLEEYEELIVRKKRLETLINSQKTKHGPEFEKFMGKAENLLLDIENKLPEFKTKVMNIFSLEFPLKSKKAGFYMEEMDSYVRELEGDLAKEADILLELSDKSMEEIHKVHSHVLYLLILLGLGAFFIGIIISFYLIHSIIGPVSNLIQTTRRIKRGDLATRAKIQTNDEIAELASSFNEMVDKLLDTQERTLAIFEGSGDAMCVIDKNFNILQVNNQMCRLAGLSAEEMIAGKCYEYFPSEHCRTDNCVLNRVLRGEKMIALETVKETNVGENVPVALVATPFKSKGEIVGVIESFRDISDRKHSEMEAEKKSEEQKLLLDNVEMQIWYVIDEKTYGAVNKVRADFLGVGPRDLEGKSVCDTLRLEDAQWCMAGNKEVFEKKIKVTEENWIVNGKGIKRLLSITKAPKLDKNGQVEYIVCAAEDITEKRKMEEELLKAQKLESVGTLAGGIAHDFNNMLTAILGNISLARIWANPDDKIFQPLTEAEKATGQAKKLTQQLLTFAKGGAPIKQTASILEVIKESVGFALRGSNVKCNYNLTEGLRLVEIDTGQIGQVIHNLIINADQAMPEGGIIEVSAENIIIRETGSLPLPEGKYVKIIIKDKGCGIAEEYLSKVFDPYFTTKEQGNGLGLAIVYSVITKHGGYITVESELEVGTTFSLYLPVSKEGVLKEKKFQEQKIIPGRGRILVMDDEKMVRDVADALLKEVGYEVVLAKDGEEAIKLYQQAKESQSPFVAVIMDLTIPGAVGGKKAVKALLKIDPGVKAIVSSGYSNDPVLANFREYGFSGVISKPYTIKKLSEIVNKVV